MENKEVVENVSELLIQTGLDILCSFQAADIPLSFSHIQLDCLNAKNTNNTITISE